MTQLNKDLLLNKLSKNLKALRKKNNYTQEYVAEKTGIHLVTYQRYEYNKNNNIKLFNLYKIVSLYNVTLDDLIK